MKYWVSKHYRTLVIFAFLIPIITVAVVSISHVTQWYGVSNPLSWAVYLSIGIEIAAMSALAAISANMGKNVYLPFIVVTIVQFIGNIFFSYVYIDVNSASFQSWVELVSPIVQFIGIEPTDLISHKRFLALIAGGLLPVISLSFLHMLVKFTNEEKSKTTTTNVIVENNNDGVSDGVSDGVTEELEPKQTVEASDLMGEVSRVRLTDEDLNKLQKVMNKFNYESTDNVVEDNQTAEEFEDEPLDEEDIDREDEIDDYISEYVDNFVKERLGYNPKPELEQEFKDTLRDEVLDKIHEKKVDVKPQENAVEEKKKL